MSAPQQFTATLLPAMPVGPSAAQTPWTQDIDGGGFDLSNVRNIDVTGNFMRNGMPLAITQQTDKTSVNQLNTVYPNTTGKTMFVMACLNLNAKVSVIDAFSDGNNPPTTRVAEVADPANNSGVTLELFFMVLPGNYYEIDVVQGTPTVVSWIEYT
jgi:hypothetical protein